MDTSVSYWFRYCQGKEEEVVVVKVTEEHALVCGMYYCEIRMVSTKLGNHYLSCFSLLVHTRDHHSQRSQHNLALNTFHFRAIRAYAHSSSLTLVPSPVRLLLLTIATSLQTVLLHVLDVITPPPLIAGLSSQSRVKPCDYEYHCVRGFLLVSLLCRPFKETELSLNCYSCIQPCATC